MLSHEKINKIYKSRKNILEIVKRLGYNTTDYENFSEQEIDILLSTNQLDMVLYKKKVNNKDNDLKYEDDINDDIKDDDIKDDDIKDDDINDDDIKDDDIKDDDINDDDINDDNKKTKIYINYNINSSKINADQNFINKINDFFEESEDKSIFLNKNDTLIMIIDLEPTDRIKKTLTHIYINSGFFVVLHYIDRLQYNILNHKQNPKEFYILNKIETANFYKKHLIKSSNSIQPLDSIQQISRYDPYALIICLRPNQIVRTTTSSVNSFNSNKWSCCVDLHD
jgi:hypothetical protein